MAEREQAGRRRGGGKRGSSGRVLLQLGRQPGIITQTRREREENNGQQREGIRGQRVWSDPIDGPGNDRRESEGKEGRVVGRPTELIPLDRGLCHHPQWYEECTHPMTFPVALHPPPTRGERKSIEPCLTRVGLPSSCSAPSFLPPSAARRDGRRGGPAS